MSETKSTYSSLSLMGLASIKQDTISHHSNQIETNKLIESLTSQNLKINERLDRLDNSVQQLNLAVTNLINSQTQTNQKIDKLTEKLDKTAENVSKLWQERWLYRLLPLSILGCIAIGAWQLITNWENIIAFFNAMNNFFIKN